MLSFTQGFDVVVSTLAQVEGVAWAKRQRDNNGYDVGTLYQAWCEWQESEPEYCAKYPDHLVDPNSCDLPGDSAIYGESGYTRYFVRMSGTIVCSRYHMPPESPKIDKINELGIDWF